MALCRPQLCGMGSSRLLERLAQVTAGREEGAAGIPASASAPASGFVILHPPSGSGALAGSSPVAQTPATGSAPSSSYTPMSHMSFLQSAGSHLGADAVLLQRLGLLLDAMLTPGACRPKDQLFCRLTRLKHLCSGLPDELYCLPPCPVTPGACLRRPHPAAMGDGGPAVQRPAAGLPTHGSQVPPCWRRGQLRPCHGGTRSFVLPVSLQGPSPWRKCCPDRAPPVPLDRCPCYPHHPGQWKSGISYPCVKPSVCVHSHVHACKKHQTARTIPYVSCPCHMCRPTCLN